MALKYLPFLPLHYNCSCLTWSNMGLVGIEVLSLRNFSLPGHLSFKSRFKKSDLKV